MAGLFDRLFGKKKEAAGEAPPPPPPPPRLIPRRLPACVSHIPLATIDLSDAPFERPRFLGLDVNTAVISPPLELSEVDCFTVIDVETTGLDPLSGEILEVSALAFEHFEPVSLFTALVRPERFSSVPTVAGDVNKITTEEMLSAVYFKEIGESLQRFLDPAQMIVGHNLPFDVKFLFLAGIKFPPEKLYVDSCYTAKKYLGYHGKFKEPRLTSFRLEDVCAYYKVPFSDAHYSASDCLATGLAFKALMEDMASYEEPKPDYVPAAYISPKDFSPRCELDPASPLYGKKIVFTGELSTDRREAMQMAVDSGMKLMSTVSKRTDYLVRGTYLNPAYESSKYKKAVELNASGEGHIQILDEAGFLSLIGKGAEA